MDISQKQRRNNDNLLSGNPIDSIYKVGEIVVYNQGKIYGYVLQVLDDFVKVINDHCNITKIRLSEIDKKIPFEKKAFTRDAAGHILYLEDVVKVCEGYNKGKKGTIKNIQKNTLFLYDPNNFAQSSGIFVENIRNVLILGTEFLKGDPHNKAVAPMNKIIRDKLIDKIVLCIKGAFKGQRGRVTQINGDEAIVELFSKPKKISIEKSHL